jgi:hypothetical protein
MLRNEILLSLHLVQGRLVHFCWPGANCSCRHRGDAVTLVSKLLIRAAYKRRPKPPQKDEWTSVSACLAFEVFTLALGGLGRSVFERSVSARMAAIAAQRIGPGLDIVPAAAAQLQPVVGHKADGAVYSLDWHRLAGSRISYVRCAIMPVSKQFQLTAGAIIIGCEETVSYHHFTGTVELFDYVSDRKHPCGALMQFLPSFMQGEHPASRIVCETIGWYHPSQILRFEPLRANMLRSACVGASMRTYIRHFYRFKKMPWPLALIGDPEVREEVKVDTGRWFVSMCEKRLDAGFGRPLRAMTGTSLDLISESGVLRPF